MCALFLRRGMVLVMTACIRGIAKRLTGVFLKHSVTKIIN